jgi:hypothetical protein
VVGSELAEDDSTTAAAGRAHARDLPGRLVYSANQHIARPVCSIWSTRTASGYFNLGGVGLADDAALEAAGGGPGARSRPGASDAPPVHLHRLGYRSRKGVTAGPWDEGPGGAPDLDEQRRAFAAFRRVWATAAALDGVYIWNWYGYGGLGTTSYTPRGKPAELEVRSLLGAL